MHEVGLVQTMLDEAARAAGGRPIRQVHVALGRLADVSREALDFYFAELRRGTPAAGADLIVRDEPGAVRCAECGRLCRVISPPEQCPACHSARLQLVGGTGLVLEAIDVD
jgi:hydrogenase nickel insertion protein HypA